MLRYALLYLPMLRWLCYAMLCYVLNCCEMIWFDMLGYALPCLAMLCNALLLYEFALLCCARFCLALLRLAMLEFALLCYVWLCLGWLCFADAPPGTAKIVVRKNQAFPDTTKTQVHTNWAFPNIMKIVVRKLPVLFFSCRNRAYRYFLEPECCVPAVSSRKKPYSDPNRRFLEKMFVCVPFVGGGTAEPQKWKIT